MSMRMRMKRAALTSAFSAALVVASVMGKPAFAGAATVQASAATLNGLVVDTTKAVVPGATVTIVNVSTHLQQVARTDERGAFTFPLLQPGTYDIRAERDGFAIAELNRFVLNVGEQSAIRIELKARALVETVTVQSAAGRISTSPAVSTLVDRQFVENMPLNGRSFNALLELTPGVVLTPATNSNSGQFSVNGQRSNANYFMVDGVGANIGVTSGTSPSLRQTAGGSLPAVSALGGTNTLVSVDAVQEFRVQTSSFAAEFGRSPGAQVSIVTRSGTNAFHGTLFNYFRNEAMDANDWFANSRNLPKARLRQNDFGGVVGGPIVPSNTFFFISYEGLRLRQPRTRVTLVPSSIARQEASTSVMAAILNAFPRPNGPTFNNGTAEFAASLSQPVTVDATSVRLDHTLGSRMQVFGRYGDSPSRRYQQGAADAFALSTHSTTRLNTKTITLGATLTPASFIVNDLRINLSRVTGATAVGSDEFGDAVPVPDAYLFPAYASRADSLASITTPPGVAGYLVGLSTDNQQRQLNIIDNVTLVRGRHQVKVGLDYRRLAPINGYRKYDFGVLFSTIAQMQAGTTPFARFTTRDTNGLRPLFTNLSIYAQDTWQAASRLSLTYGVRWEYDPPPTERTQGFWTIQGLNDPSTVTLAAPGTPLWKASKDNFAPRLGVAYHVRQGGRYEATIRAGAGVFYDLTNPAAAGGLTNFPYARTTTFTNRLFPLDSSLLTPIPFSGQPPFGSVDSVSDPGLTTPYTYQWNAALDLLVGSSQNLTVTYVGASGQRLLVTQEFVNPNPNFTSLSVTRNGASSSYKALQLQFQRRLSKGLQALVSYSLAHAVDSGSVDAFVLNGLTSTNPDLEKGDADFDVRHAFSAAITYNVPMPVRQPVLRAVLRDWWLDGMFRARTGSPINVTYSRNVPTVGDIPLRPDIVPDVPLYNRDPSAPGARLFNVNAFKIPAETRQGTLPRNGLRGFAVSQLDIAIRRQVAILRGVKLQFRAEAFNVLNTAAFGNPTGALASAQFGRATAMFNQSLGGSSEGSFNPLYQIGGPRSIQLAAKLIF